MKLRSSHVEIWCGRTYFGFSFYINRERYQLNPAASEAMRTIVRRLLHEVAPSRLRTPRRCRLMAVYGGSGAETNLAVQHIPPQVFTAREVNDWAFQVFALVLNPD